MLQIMFYSTTCGSLLIAQFDIVGLVKACARITGQHWIDFSCKQQSYMCIFLLPHLLIWSLNCMSFNYNMSFNCRPWNHPMLHSDKYNMYTLWGDFFSCHGHELSQFLFERHSSLWTFELVDFSVSHWT